MLLISVWQVVLAAFFVYVFTYLVIHVSTDDKNVFWDAINKGGLFVIEGDEVSFVTNIGRAVAGDYCCSRATIKRGYHRPRHMLSGKNPFSSITSCQSLLVHLLIFNTTGLFSKFIWESLFIVYCNLKSIIFLSKLMFSNTLQFSKVKKNILPRF